jgi:hypothetical protein
MHDFTLSDVTFGLVDADISPRTMQTNTLTIRVEMIYPPDRYKLRSWSFADAFRLKIDEALIALHPTSNEQSVKFVIPRETTSATLKIIFARESTDISLNLAPQRNIFSTFFVLV